MAKKDKKTTSEQVPSKRQLSKWQRQMKIRRIVIIAAVVFLVGIASWVGYGYYKDYQSNPLRQVVIKVNGVPFNMGYFVDTIKAYANMYGINSTILSYYGDYFADVVADNIIDAELLRQGAKSLNITVTADEINAALRQYGWPTSTTYQDIMRASLLSQNVSAYFGSQLPATMEQADVQVMLVESEEVVDEATAKIEASGNLTAFVGNFSCNSTIQGDLGRLPEELMPNSLIANAAFNFTVGQTIYPIYDETAIKDIGYWLIEVTGNQSDKIDALVMLLGSKAQADQIRAELVAGGNFSALAGNYSQHASRTIGGKIDGLKRGDMGSTDFDAVAFNITHNTVSQPVKDTSAVTTGGYWLIKVVDRGNYTLVESVRTNLIRKHFNAWLENWANESKIDTYLDATNKEWAINKASAEM